MKKCLCIFAVAVLVLFNLNAEILPIDKYLGQTCTTNSTSEHEYLAKVLKEPFSVEWAENNLSDFCRNAVTNLYSEKLIQILPSDSFTMSKAEKNGDNSYTIGVRFSNMEEIWSFVVLNNSITGVSLVNI